MANLNMDLTGLQENYALRDRVYRIFKYGQLVDFEKVIFEDSLKVYMVSAGTGTYELEKGVDWEVPEECISSCDNDMSAAKLMDPSFNRQLISGIRMLKGVDPGTYYTISIFGQQLYPNQIRTAYFHNTAIDFTPELAQEIMARLEQLTILTSRVTDVSSITNGNAIFLELDTSCTNDCNYIQDEVHLVKVAAGRFIIHPKGGSFYADSVTVKHPGTGEVLKEGKDYFITGMNVAKTKATSYTAPVYDFILVIAPIVDELEVSYHAYGGDPTLDNYRDLLQDVRNIVQYLNDAKTLTTESLGSTEIMTALMERIDKMETRMRRLEGTPAYGDITSGKSILMKLFTDQKPSDLHWWTIASLYTTNGDQMRPCTADTFMFRCQTAQSHFQFTAAVSVDLQNTLGNRFNVNILAENYPRGFVPFEKYSNIERIIRPQLRIIWKDSPEASGAYLQLGFELKGMLEETVAIEDISGHESCWKLVDEIKSASLPQDSDFALPGGQTWSYLLDDCKSESILMPFHRGHLLWAGALALSQGNGWNDSKLAEGLMLNVKTDIQRISKLRLDLEEDGGMRYAVDVPFNPGTAKVCGRTVDIYADEPVYYNCELYRQADGVTDQLILDLNWNILAEQSNPLTLRDIVVYTD